MPSCNGDNYTQQIDRTECIGNSLPKINSNFQNLDAVLCETVTKLEDYIQETSTTSLSVVDSPTIDLSYNSKVRVLSANISGKIPNINGGAGVLTGMLKSNVGIVSQAIPDTDFPSVSTVNARFNAKIDLPTNPQKHQVLTYSPTTNSWVASAAVAYIDPVDVYATLSQKIQRPENAQNEDVLTFNYVTQTWVASAGVNRALVESKITKPITASAHQVLTFDPSTFSWVASAAEAGVNKIDKPYSAFPFGVLTYDINTETWVTSAAAPPVNLDGITELLNSKIDKPEFAQNYNVLVYDASTETWVASAGPAYQGDQNKISKPSPAGNYNVLTYDANTETWVASAAAYPINPLVLQNKIDKPISPQDYGFLVYNPVTTSWASSSVPLILKPSVANSYNVLTFNPATQTWVASALPVPPAALDISNKIDKPASPSAFSSLIYNPATSSWVASSGPQKITQPLSADPFSVLAYNPTTASWTPSAYTPVNTNASFRLAYSGIITDPNPRGGTRWDYELDQTNGSADPANYLVFLDGVLQVPGVEYMMANPTYVTSWDTVRFLDEIPPHVGTKLTVLALCNLNGPTGGATTVQIISSAAGERGDYIPIGQIAFYAMNAVPAGWLQCNGSFVSKTTYPGLFNAIGYTYGGSGESFRLPDLRGEFIRGWDNGRGVDVGREIGTSQGDSTRLIDHRHNLLGNKQTQYWVLNDNNSTPPDSGARLAEGPEKSNDSQWSPYTGLVELNHPDQTDKTILSKEVRPRNVALMPCIKAFSSLTPPQGTINVSGLANDLLDLESRFDRLNDQLFGFGEMSVKAYVVFNGVAASAGPISEAQLYSYSSNILSISRMKEGVYKISFTAEGAMQDNKYAIIGTSTNVKPSTDDGFGIFVEADTDSLSPGDVSVHTDYFYIGTHRSGSWQDSPRISVVVI